MANTLPRETGREVLEGSKSSSSDQENREVRWNEQKKALGSIRSVQDVFFHALPSEKQWTKARAREIFSLIPDKYREGSYTDKKFVGAMKLALAECFFDGQKFIMMESGVKDRYAEIAERLGQGERERREVQSPSRTSQTRSFQSPQQGSDLLLPPTQTAPRPPSLEPPPPPNLFTRTRNGSEKIPAHSFELNQRFYNVETLRAQLSPRIREEADFIAEKFPPEWHGPLYRNALNASSFNRNQIIILTNLSLKKAAIYFPTEGRVLLSDNFIGSGGIGNKGGENGTPLGSFRIERGPSDNKFQYRLYVHGEESERKKFIVRDPTQVVDFDPSLYGNSGSHGRTIRIHEWEGNPEESKTKGCFGFPGDIAQKLYFSIGKNGGRMESFVSL